MNFFNLALIETESGGRISCQRVNCSTSDSLILNNGVTSIKTTVICQLG